MRGTKQLGHGRGDVSIVPVGIYMYLGSSLSRGEGD